MHLHHLYRKLLDIDPSPSNRLEFCVGTPAEMDDDDLYKTIEEYAAGTVIPYVHLRNIRGRVSDYVETFIDDGDIDIGRVLRILHKHNFQMETISGEKT